MVTPNHFLCQIGLYYAIIELDVELLNLAMKLRNLPGYVIEFVRLQMMMVSILIIVM